MDIRFSTYNDFLTEYQTYKLDKCSNCEGVRELIDDDVTVVIENRTLHFQSYLFFVVINVEINVCPNIPNKL